MPNPVVHFEIGGQDAGKLRAFYAALFDWQIDATNPSYDVIAEADGGIGGGIMQIRENMAPYVSIYVRVDDLGAMLRRAAELGGRQVFGPMPIKGVGEFAMFTDPEGHLIGLFCEAPGSQQESELVGTKNPMTNLIKAESAGG